MQYEVAKSISIGRILARMDDSNPLVHPKIPPNSAMLGFHTVQQPVDSMQVLGQPLCAYSCSERVAASF